MTLIFQRALPDQPATHAFVLGVGAYPDAKPGKGVRASLQNVPDIASASESAKLMCDWLLRNRDTLSAKLGSLEVLLAPAQPKLGAQSYEWSQQADWTCPFGTPIDRPTNAAIVEGGKAWLSRVREGDIVFFYVCGHGARFGTEAVVFLSDLNESELKPWSHLNVVQLGWALKQHPKTRAAFMFVDACQETVPRFEIGDHRGDGAVFYATFDPYDDGGREKVALLAGASSGKLSYEGFEAGMPGAPQVKIGRFTQTLLKALDGASVRLGDDADWTVCACDVATDLKLLYQLRDDWRDKVFDPSPMLGIAEAIPIVTPTNPRVPVLVITDPSHHMRHCRLKMFGDVMKAVHLGTRELGSASAWVTEVSPSITKHVAVATLHDTSIPPVAVNDFERAFTPIKPIFDVRISIA